MSKNKDREDSDIIPGVACSVSGCVYHCIGNECCAQSIMVGTESASNKSDTMCATFESRF